MSSILSFEAHEWDRFSLPHALRLIGEHQHLLDAGAVSIATTLRLHVEVEETTGGFSLRFGSDLRAETGQPRSGEPVVAEFAVQWENAIEQLLVSDPSSLKGLSIHVDFAPLWGICPPEALLASPSVAVALAVALTAHRGDGSTCSEADLAQLACRLRQTMGTAQAQNADRLYSEALLSIVGGAGYVGPGGERLNVQQLLPPQSFLLAVAPGLQTLAGDREREAAAQQALAIARREGRNIMEQGDGGLVALFELAGKALDEEQTGMLYGLLRVRQMAEALLEHLGEPFVDNDRLAEVCDEESAILQDYFGFPAAYEPILAIAGEAGALGTKLTWAFGGYPTAIIIAPGRRDEVRQVLSKRSHDARFLPVDIDPIGLCADEEEQPEPALLR